MYEQLTKKTWDKRRAERPAALLDISSLNDHRINHPDNTSLSLFFIFPCPIHRFLYFRITRVIVIAMN